MNSFKSKVIKGIIDSSNNFYKDNYDEERFGKKKNKNRNNFINFIKLILNKNNNVYDDYTDIEELSNNLDNFEFLFNHLEDDKSKDLLVKVYLFRLLGLKKIKINNYINDFKKFNKTISKHFKSDKVLKSNDFKWKLNHFNLKALGYNVECFATKSGIFINQLKEPQYFHEFCNVESDDIVFDCGACWGDTTLLFADKVGSNGKVISFEFLPANLEFANININLNSELKDRIVLVNSPLWDKSGEKVPCVDWGPGSRININKKVKSQLYAETITIDDYMKNNSLDKIDYIKMDIEGAELNALKGAKNSIIKFKPKLAISIYHKITDFKDIAEFIYNLDLNYKFYLGHYTLHSEKQFCMQK